MNIKKSVLLSGLGLLSISFLALPPLSFAQTTTVSSSIQAQLDLINSLNAQIQALQQQVQAAQQQRQTAAVQLASTLRLGSQGDQVKILQALLAASSTIYPEGLITGIFGPATARAVKRFQKTNGLPQVGSVGPKTLGKLNEWLSENPLQFESTSTASSTVMATSTMMPGGDHENQQGNNNQGGNQNGEGEHGHLCAIVPPGHFIAPGWLRKHGNAAPILPHCQTLPPGIGDNFGHQFPTSTPSTTVPMVFGISANAGTSTATINWSSNEPANSQVMYGLTSSYGSSTALDQNFVTSHAEAIAGLTSATVYHFQVFSTDSANRTATSSDMTFVTNAVTAASPLVMSSVAATAGTSTATVSWSTNNAANSQVFYGLTSSYGSSTALDAGLVTSHMETLTGLTPSTTYHFQANSIDASNGAATSTDMTLTTYALSPALPIISGISFSAASTSANIFWSTNVPANGQVFFATSSPLVIGAASTLSVSTTTLSASHALTLTGLAASTTYFYVIQSTDASSNITTSSQQSFMTPGQ